MSKNTIVTGDNSTTMVQLGINGEFPDISSASSVMALLVQRYSKEAYMDAPVLQSPNTPGASWPVGLVAVVFPGASTDGIIFQGDAAIEMQVTYGDGTQKTWFAPINVRKGWV